MFELEVTESFELKFAKIYPDFTRDLVNLVDNLSPSEIKLCMCIKMSYSNVQIKDYMKISDSTIANLRSSSGGSNGEHSLMWALLPIYLFQASDACNNSQALQSQLSALCIVWR